MCGRRGVCAVASIIVCVCVCVCMCVCVCVFLCARRPRRIAKKVGGRGVRPPGAKLSVPTNARTNPMTNPEINVNPKGTPYTY